MNFRIEKQLLFCNMYNITTKIIYCNSGKIYENIFIDRTPRNLDCSRLYLCHFLNYKVVKYIQHFSFIVNSEIDIALYTHTSTLRNSTIRNYNKYFISKSFHTY